MSYGPLSVITAIARGYEPKTDKQAVIIKNGERSHSMTRCTMKKQKIPARCRWIPTRWPWRSHYDIENALNLNVKLTA